MSRHVLRGSFVVVLVVSFLACKEIRLVNFFMASRRRPTGRGRGTVPSFESLRPAPGLAAQSLTSPLVVSPGASDQRKDQFSDAHPESAANRGEDGELLLTLATQ